MSTRSGKRIHSSFFETTSKPEHVAQSERKTRSRRFKDDVEELSVSVMKPKKRKNYVSYPVTDYEAMTDTVENKEDEAKPTRSLRRNALKEQNNITSSTESTEPLTEVLKLVRTSRRTRKLAEEAEEAQENCNHVEEVVNGKIKLKKEKKKKKSIETEVVSRKKSKKKGKKARTSGSMAVEDILPENGKKSALNRSTTSEDSFFSAAGSPVRHGENNITSPTVKDSKIDSKLKRTGTDKPAGRQTRSVARQSFYTNIESTSDNTVKTSRKRKSSLIDFDTTATGNEIAINAGLEEIDSTLTNVPKKRKSSIRDTVSNRNDGSNGEIKDSTFDVEDLERRQSGVKAVINSTFDKSETPKSDTTFNKDLLRDRNTTYEEEEAPTSKSQTPESKLNSTYDKLDQKTPFEVKTEVREQPAVNSTFEKDDPIIDITLKSATMNTSYEKDPTIDIILKSATMNTSYEKDPTIDITLKSATMNTTYEKDPTIDIILKSATMNTSYEKDPTIDITLKSATMNTSYEKDPTIDITLKSATMNTTYEKDPTIDITLKSATMITNYEKDPTIDITLKSAIINTTYEKDPTIDITLKSAVMNATYEKDSDNNTKQNPKIRQSSIINDTYEKDDISSDISEDIDSNTNLRNSMQTQSTELNSTYDKMEKSDTTFDKDKNPTLDKEKKLDITFDKNSKSSIMSSDISNITLDKSDVSRISITSDDSKDNIVNTTPVLIESSMDESQINTSKPSPQSNLRSPESSKIITETPVTTPLKREGTFTIDGSDITAVQDDLPEPPTRKMSLPSPGCTPFPNRSSSKSVINITRSLEKSRRSSLAEPLPRTTKVMFCSPVNNPVLVAQQRRKVIKSNLKGSNKSFVFEDAGQERRAAPRKRSYTHGDAEEARAKRNRADGAQPLGRSARGRTTSATANDPDTPQKATTPRKSETKISRTKLPNFAALHRREFAKMESLDECQARRARRARQLLTPTGAVTVLERSSPRESTETKKSEDGKKSPNLPKESEDSKERTNEKRPKEAKKPETPIKSLPSLKSLNPGYTRFGFKLNCDVNPFCITKSVKNSQTVSSKKIVKKDLTRPLKEIRGLKKQATLPSLTGTTSARELAKQTVMREKSFTDKRNRIRNENRTVIKGVRTNRRFELQMRMRNIE